LPSSPHWAPTIIVILDVLEGTNCQRIILHIGLKSHLIEVNPVGDFTGSYNMIKMYFL
jgi:hypothetical protein